MGKLKVKNLHTEDMKEVVGNLSEMKEGYKYFKEYYVDNGLASEKDWQTHLKKKRKKRMNI